MNIFCDCKFAYYYFCRHHKANQEIHQKGADIGEKLALKTGCAGDGLRNYLQAKKKMKVCAYQTKKTIWQKLIHPGKEEKRYIHDFKNFSQEMQLFELYILKLL